MHRLRSKLVTMLLVARCTARDCTLSGVVEGGSAWSFNLAGCSFVDLSASNLPEDGLLALAEVLNTNTELTSLSLLDSEKVQKTTTKFTGSNGCVIEKISRTGNNVWIDSKLTTGFTNLTEEAWNFHIGGYQVCEKWLKDRKGRKLSKDDITHYQKIVVALTETVILMNQVDKVIEEHGGWPGAFKP
jgi:hypothetical protein